MTAGEITANRGRPQRSNHEFPRFLGRLGVDFPKVSFHDLRHTHARQLLLDGVRPKVVRKRLGHAGIGIALETYSHVSPSMQEETAARLDAALGGAIRSGGKPVR